MKSKFFSLIGLVLIVSWGGWGYAASMNGVPTYLALGDSLAYGMQIGHLRQEMKSGTVDAASFDTGYVNRLAAILRYSMPNLRVVDLGCPGETTSSFISGPCAFATNGTPFGHKPLPMHVKYKGAPHSSPHYVAGMELPNMPLLRSISVNRRIRGSSRCFGMFGINS